MLKLVFSFTIVRNVEREMMPLKIDAIMEKNAGGFQGIILYLSGPFCGPSCISLPLNGGGVLDLCVFH